MKRGNKKFSIFAAFGHSYLNGMVLGWSAPGIPKLLDLEQSPFGHVVTQGNISLITALPVSGILLMPVVGALSNKFGRRPIMVSTALVRFLTWVMLAKATDIRWLYVARAIEAQASSVAYPASFVYLSEIADVQTRGLTLTLPGFFVNLGILTMYSFGPFVSYSELGVVGACFSFAVFVMLLFVPESPTFYMLSGKSEKADKSLKFLNGTNYDAEKELCEVMLDNASGTNGSIYSNMKELFTVKRNLRSFLIIAVITIAQQCTGISAVVFHMTTIFETAGSAVPAHIATILAGTIQLLPCLVSSLLVDRIGRKTLLLISCLVCALTNCAMGFNFFLEHINSPLVQYISWLPFTSIIIFIIFHWIGLGVIPGSLTGELLSPNIKCLGSSIIFTIEIMTALIISSSFGFVNAGLGSHTTFWIFSFCCAATSVVVIVFVPETKGLSYKEIQQMIR